MGDPRRLRKKYSGPGHPWQAARIQEEKGLVHEFGLRNKRELWKAESVMKAFSAQAKRLIALRTAQEGGQAEVERKQLLDRLSRLGVLSSAADLDDVLSLSVSDVLARRLQSVLVKNGLARTPKQARQFIVHGHVMIDGRKISAPSYLVPVAEEAKISFVGRSSLSNPDHPERADRPKEPVKDEQPVEAEQAEKPKKKVEKTEKPEAKSESAESEKKAEAEA